MIDYVTFFEWNCYKANKPKRVRRFLSKRLRKGKYDVVVLTEAMKFHDEIREVAKALGYHMLTEDPKPGFLTADPRTEHGNTVMLVKIQPDLLLVRWRVEPMTVPWTVWSHDQRHLPRRQVVALLEGRGGLWIVAGQHWATKGNHAAQKQSLQWTRGLLSQTQPIRDVKVVASSLGDHNMSVAALKRLFLNLKVQGHSVDSIITEGSKVWHNVLGKGGGDHHANEFKVTR